MKGGCQTLHKGFWHLSLSGINVAQEGVAHAAPICIPNCQKCGDLFSKIDVFVKNEPICLIKQRVYHS